MTGDSKKDRSLKASIERISEKIEQYKLDLKAAHQEDNKSLIKEINRHLNNHMAILKAMELKDG